MVNILVSIFAFMKPYKVGGGNEQKKKANFMLINFLPSMFDFRPPEWGENGVRMGMGMGMVMLMIIPAGWLAWLTMAKPFTEGIHW